MFLQNCSSSQKTLYWGIPPVTFKLLCQTKIMFTNADDYYEAFSPACQPSQAQEEYIYSDRVYPMTLILSFIYLYQASSLIPQCLSKQSRYNNYPARMRKG